MALETVDDKRTFVGNDGSLMTLMRIDGARKIVGGVELEELNEGARIALAPYLDRAGHAFQVWFVRDPDGAPTSVARALQPAEKAASAIGLELDDLFNERKRRLPSYLAAEGLYMALWTRPVSLTKSQAEQAKKEAGDFLKGQPKNVRGMRLAFTPENIRSRHLGFITSMQQDMSALGLRCELMEVHEALRTIRTAVYPDTIDNQWKPSLPGDPTPSRGLDGGEKNDISALIWPTLSQQMFNRDAEQISPTAVRVGDLLFTGVDLTLAPEEVQAFSALLSRLTENRMPWRISFLFEGGGADQISMKGIFASLLTWASDDNKRINNAIKQLKASTIEGETIVKFRVSFATWAKVDEEKVLRERGAVLLRAIEGWGHCQASDMAGDPLEGVMSSGLGLAVRSTAPAGIAPIKDAVYWLPWGRAANPWKAGPVLFRTPDGKPWPYQPGSSQQTSWIDLVFAPPGYGKSVLMNTINLACCLAPGTSTGSAKLPRIAIIDIGPSSSGLVSLMQEALPEGRKHEAMYKRLQMRPDNAINPFDTQLGSRHPLPSERAFIVNLLTLLATPLGQPNPYDGMSDLVGIVVDEMYKMFSEAGMPRPYSQGDDTTVDQYIKDHNISLQEKPTWWEVVDALHDSGNEHGAMLAQRYAVPVLQDVVVAARSRAVEDLFADTKIPTGESVIVAFTRMISGSIREYPILASPTRFDIGGARVCALDLDEVAPRGGASADRQTAVMYMLARYVLARDYFLNEEVLKSFTPSYRPFHMARIRELRESPKRLIYDEFHRTGAADAVRAQVKIDIREGRKWGVQICLASQLLDDFDDQMVDQATGIWILGAGSEGAVKECTERFALGATAKFVLRHRLSGPTSAGAPLMAVLSLKDGRYEQFLVNTLGPVELWAMSTTAEDAEIRKRLYNRVGPRTARSRLAERFPSGSAKGEIERRVASMAESADDGLDEEAANSLIDVIVEELVQMRSTEELEAQSGGKLAEVAGYGKPKGSGGERKGKPRKGPSKGKRPPAGAKKKRRQVPAE
ncbi:MAG: hypothetical protein KI792_07335 [Alphaproteobacteria bacterium]|nr:hypothetical protein [Alphaproteobacteria bacterium SS10]